MSEDCKYCDKDFSSRKEKLEHELDEHEDEMSSHDKSDKKSELNKLQQKKKTKKHNRKKKLQYGAVGLLLVGLVAGGGFWASQNIEFGGVQTTNTSAGIGTPVHWHAPYTLSVCGENRILQGGPKMAHTHGQSQFHLEGVRNKEQATLDWIVDSLGGKLENNSIMGKTSCNGEPANLTVKVNGQELENPLNYVVQDEDNIKIKYE
jgi:hypothetical protein